MRSSTPRKRRSSLFDEVCWEKKKKENKKKEEREKKKERWKKR